MSPMKTLHAQLLKRFSTSSLAINLHIIYLQFSPNANNFTEGNETFFYLLIVIDILFV